MKRLKAKKIMALFLASAMTLSLAGCGGNNATTETAAETTETAQEAEEEAEAPAEEEESAQEAQGEVSIDFEDGAFGFVGSDKSVSSAADDSVFSVEDYNGSKALKVTPQGKMPYVGIQADALLSFPNVWYSLRSHVRTAAFQSRIFTRPAIQPLAV